MTYTNDNRDRIGRFAVKAFSAPEMELDPTDYLDDDGTSAEDYDIHEFYDLHDNVFGDISAEDEAALDQVDQWLAEERLRQESAEVIDDYFDRPEPELALAGDLRAWESTPF